MTKIFVALILGFSTHTTFAAINLIQCALKNNSTGHSISVRSLLGGSNRDIYGQGVLDNMKLHLTVERKSKRGFAVQLLIDGEHDEVFSKSFPASYNENPKPVFKIAKWDHTIYCEKLMSHVAPRKKKK